MATVGRRLSHVGDDINSKVKQGMHTLMNAVLKYYHLEKRNPNAKAFSRMVIDYIDTKRQIERVNFKKTGYLRALAHYIYLSFIYNRLGIEKTEDCFDILCFVLSKMQLNQLWGKLSAVRALVVARKDLYGVISRDLRDQKFEQALFLIDNQIISSCSSLFDVEEVTAAITEVSKELGHKRESLSCKKVFIFEQIRYILADIKALLLESAQIKENSIPHDVFALTSRKIEKHEDETANLKDIEAESHGIDIEKEQRLNMDTKETNHSAVIKSEISDLLKQLKRLENGSRRDLDIQCFVKCVTHLLLQITHENNAEKFEPLYESQHTIKTTRKTPTITKRKKNMSRLDGNTLITNKTFDYNNDLSVKTDEINTISDISGADTIPANKTMMTGDSGAERVESLYLASSTCSLDKISNNTMNKANIMGNSDNIYDRINKANAADALFRDTTDNGDIVIYTESNLSDISDAPSCKTNETLEFNSKTSVLDDMSHIPTKCSSMLSYDSSSADAVSYLARTVDDSCSLSSIKSTSSFKTGTTSERSDAGNLFTGVGDNYNNSHHLTTDSSNRYSNASCSFRIASKISNINDTLGISSDTESNLSFITSTRDDSSSNLSCSRRDSSQNNDLAANVESHSSNCYGTASDAAYLSDTKSNSGNYYHSTTETIDHCHDTNIIPVKTDTINDVSSADANTAEKTLKFYLNQSESDMLFIFDKETVKKELGTCLKCPVHKYWEMKKKKPGFNDGIMGNRKACRQAYEAYFAQDKTTVD